MEFRTKVSIPRSGFLISHRDKMLMMGSCFTENIGNYLHSYRFQINTNPFGIIYNPYSIFQNLGRIAINQLYKGEELIQQNGLYLSLDHHGSFSGTEKDDVLQKINASIGASHKIFEEAGYIFLTPGTSFVYNYEEKDKIVANCHKIPNAAFEKRLLSPEEIMVSFDKIHPFLKNKTVVFTVSPVRHWRDGAVENQLSKSILIEAIHRIVSKYDNCFYFPAYEIVMDELRDYRFYEADMLHPNKVAIQYIWEKFSDAYFSEETKSINKRIEEINLLLQHRIMKANTKAEGDFKAHIARTIDAFNKDYPDMKFDFLPFTGSSSNIGNSM